jgi:uncharacterized protein (DUF697 family)
VPNETRGKQNPWSLYKETIRRAFEGGYDGATAEEKVRGVRKLVRLSSATAAALAVQPVPLVDSAVMTPIQHRMVEGVIRICRGRADEQAQHEIFTALRGDVVAPHVAIAGMKLIPFVPILPDLVAVSIAYALTSAIGEVSIRYCGPGAAMTRAELRGAFAESYRERFERTYRQSRKEVKAMFSGNAEIRRRMRELRDARRAGDIGDQEAEDRADEILAAGQRR